MTSTKPNTVGIFININNIITHNPQVCTTLQVVAKELLPATHLILDSDGPSSESRRGHALGQYRCEEDYKISEIVSALCLAKTEQINWNSIKANLTQTSW